MLKPKAPGGIRQAYGMEPYFADEHAVVVVMACSDAYVPYCSVAIHSVIRHASRERKYDIILFSCQVTKRHQWMLQKMAEPFFNISIRFAEVGPYISSCGLYTRDYYHPVIYARLCMPDLMKGYKKAVYLDADLVVLCDIAQLFDQELNGSLLAGVRDAGMLAWYGTQEHIEQVYIDTYLRLKNPYAYINTGVLLLQLEEIRKQYSARSLMEYAASRRWRWQDQDIIMTLFEGKIQLLDAAWNVLAGTKQERDQIACRLPETLAKEYRQAYRHPRILHFAGNRFLHLQQETDEEAVFWMYAKESPFYEIILKRAMAKCCEDGYKRKREDVLQQGRRLLHLPFRILFDGIFPKGCACRKKLVEQYYMHRYFRSSMKEKHRPWTNEKNKGVLPALSKPDTGRDFRGCIPMLFLMGGAVFVPGLWDFLG